MEFSPVFSNYSIPVDLYMNNSTHAAEIPQVQLGANFFLCVCQVSVNDSKLLGIYSCAYGPA